MILRTSHSKRKSSFSVTLKLSAVFVRLVKGTHLENNQSDIDNCFYSRYVFQANVLDKYDDYSKDFKKEFSSSHDKPERIGSVPMKYVYIEKYHPPIVHFIYDRTSHSY